MALIAIVTGTGMHYAYKNPVQIRCSRDNVFSSDAGHYYSSGKGKSVGTYLFFFFKDPE